MCRHEPDNPLETVRSRSFHFRIKTKIVVFSRVKSENRRRMQIMISLIVKEGKWRHFDERLVAVFPCFRVPIVSRLVVSKNKERKPLGT
jgi:hypothetical protein